MRILLLLLISVSVYSQTNPLLPAGADPWSTYKDGYYYYTHTMGNQLKIWKTKSLGDLKNAAGKTIWRPTEGTMYSKNIWAPEIHFLNNKWYVYFAADDGKNANHRMYVLENASPDPMEGQWIFKGKLADADDKWAIDGSVFTYEGSMYMIWSGWVGDKNGQQDIFIARLKNPWTIEGKRVKIGEPTFDWEKNGDLKDGSNPNHINVNEGPQMLKHDGNLFIIFSASGCWTDNYSLGMMKMTGKNIMNPAAWKKHSQPLFVTSAKNGVYAPGHNSFFKSPDGKEDWILYHANAAPGQGCGGHRSPRAQKISWTADGNPDFGEPVSTSQVFSLPGQ